eukprot:TRINITY_DN27729_c0_g1_i1.p1 TRINITY_DN27729_c0_g1~~TRINITY_DN27729_c0_g1_i1.p1  ORF type:complete len:152 (+),score=21.23 TRINITY_DN27729_c0_g1_i1:68-523(+)
MLAICLFFVWFALSVVAAEEPQTSFDDMVASDEVQLVEFYHPLCGTCKEFAPTFEELTEQVRGKMQVHRVSVADRIGEKVAIEIGALDEGIPNIRLLNHKGDRSGTKIMIGEDPPPSATVLKERIDAIFVDYPTSNLRGAKYLKSDEVPEL